MQMISDVEIKYLIVENKMIGHIDRILEIQYAIDNLHSKLLYSVYFNIEVIQHFHALQY